MKNPLSLTVVAALTCLSASSAPKAVADPVAAGFPAWEGLIPKNHLAGHEAEASDLRHRATIVVEFEAEKATEQLSPLSGLAIWATPFSSTAFEYQEARREFFVVFSNRGGRGKEAKEGLEKFYKSEKGTFFTFPTAAPVYHDVTFPGGPDAKGKYPMIYVMPGEGTEPVTNVFGDAKGMQWAMGVARGVRAVNAKRGWTDFTGVAEPKYVKGVAKALAERKSLMPALAAARAAIKSSDPEQAKEGQIVFDAIVQAKNDLIYRILYESRFSPTRACYDVQRLVALYPSAKKLESTLSQAYKVYPEVPKLAKMLDRIILWRSESFSPKNAGEARKLVAELRKYKKDLAPIKTHTVISLQNTAILLDADVDTLIEKFSAPAG